MEAGHLYGVRLVPDSYPFEVGEIVYEMADSGGECDSRDAHRVEVYVGSTVAPPNMPTNPVTLNIPAITQNMGIRVVKAPLPTSITLTVGQYLFVAVELAVAETSCIMVCQNATVTDRDYWSNATTSPYDWATLASSQLLVHARIGANAR